MTWRPLIMILCLLAARPGRADVLPFAPMPSGQLCRPAIMRAERSFAIPSHLLAAIARVESGRKDPASGSFNPWPWTINADGQGSFYDSKAQAIAAVQMLRKQGVQSIDVGCMQISLLHHPNAFGSLEQAFDPAANADYGAQFLTELHGKTNDWQKAVELYHSATPELGQPYGRQVYAALPEEQRLAGVATLDSVFPPWFATGARPGFAGAFQPSPARIIPRQTTGLAGPGGGRGLDSYRLAPVRLAFRPS
jgi:hypothetical protein